MSKRKPSSSVAFPDVVNMDDLAYLTDEELAGRGARMESDRRRAASTSSDLVPWEVEIAYVRREQQLREARSKAHAAYLSSHPQTQETVEEDIEVE